MVTQKFAINLFGRQVIGIAKSDIPALLLIALIFIRLSMQLPKAWGGGSLQAVIANSRFSPGAWVAALWVVIGVVGSFGTNAFFHWFLYERTEPFQSIRAPARWAIIAYAGLAIWGALGAREILERRRHP